MTDTIASTETTPYEVIKLDNGLSLLIGADEAAIEAYKKQAQVFYVVTNLKRSYKDNAGKAVEYVQPRVCKVISTLIGDAMIEVSNDEVHIPTAAIHANFTMPKIPWSLINEVGDFFHHVYATLGTEAIVLFTYDEAALTSDNPSGGWGYLVPKQSNSSASCDYDPTSIMDEKDDLGTSVYIVGSAHSHPAMKAFASHTDEGDQMEFDGVHITYGWAPGSKTDEYHVELLFGGTRFTLTPEQTFDEYTQPSTNPKMAELAKRVEKRVWQTGGYSSYGSYYSTGGGSGKDWSGSYSHISYIDLKGKLPKDYEDKIHPMRVTLIRKVLLAPDELKECPVCDQTLYEYNLKGRWCWRCTSYFMCKDDTLDELRAVREQSSRGNADLRWEEGLAQRSVWLWEEVLSDDKNVLSDRVQCLYDKPAGELGKGQGV